MENIVYKYTNIARYGIYSIIVTVLDVLIVNTLVTSFFVNIVIANTFGVLIGFLLHFSLSVKSVFKMKYEKTVFIVYLGTFFIGLILADSIIFVFYEVLNLGFWFSKLISVIIPFFLMYSMRKAIYNNFKKKDEL